MVLHGDVHVRWNKGVRSRVIKAIRQIAEAFSAPVWAFQTQSHDPKKRKFIKDTGGILHHYRFTDGGERAEMYLYVPWINPKEN